MVIKKRSRKNQPKETLPPRAWHALNAQEVQAQLDVNAESGLTEDEARKRLEKYGPNQLHKEEEEGIIEELLESLREPMVLLLLATGVLYSIFGGPVDAITIFVVILTLAGIEVFMEHRAHRAIAALRELAEPTAPVRRGGQYIVVNSEKVVPGDLILLQAGRRVAADARLTEAYGLAADESLLTGESVPLDKEANLTLPADTPLAERGNLAFAGSMITRGRGAALVVATGLATELGRVASLAAEAKPPRTPLQITMRELTRWMVFVALGVSVLVPLLGWLVAHQPWRQMVLTGFSLAYATIPEELPIIIIMVLALGAYRLSKRQAIIKRLKAVETLGTVTVIAADKTGTLTENRMQVDRVFPQEMKTKLLEIGALCNDAVASGIDFAGDPLETALLRASRDAGLDIGQLRRSHLLRQEFTFDNIRKMMSVIYSRDGKSWAAIKGAPEAVLAHSTRRWTKDGEVLLTDADNQAFNAMAGEMGNSGLRVIALAEKAAANDQMSQEETETNLTFVGLVALADPPRSEARDAIAACRAAGIRPVMVTGDHPLTAQSIAGQVGLDGKARVLTGPELDALSDEALAEVAGEVSVYARTTPEHKLRILHALHRRGERVAVTGDGVNDAPALAAADIGVAMGQTGTDVARESADLVLADDNFSTIVHAVEEGRLLFENLKKAIRYYLSCKVALISATLLPVLLAVPVPFAPIQIILMELLMDLAAAATFLVEGAESDLMARPPRDPRVPFMNRGMVGSIFGSAAGLFAAVSVAYLVTWYSGAALAVAQTVAFVTWLLGHVLLAVNLRSEREPLLRLGLFSNRLMIAWAAVTVAFVLFATLVPAVHSVLRTETLSAGQWGLAIGMAAAGAFWIEARKWLTPRSSASGLPDLRPS